MSTSTRPAWSDDCFKPAAGAPLQRQKTLAAVGCGQLGEDDKRHVDCYPGGVHADEAADWLGLGHGAAVPEMCRRRRRRSLREALEARAVPTQHAAGQTTARKSMREPAERYQRELPPPPVAPPSRAGAASAAAAAAARATQTDSRRLGRRHFGGARTRPEGLLVWDESAHEAAVRARGPTAASVGPRAPGRAGACVPPAASVRGRRGASSVGAAPAPTMGVILLRSVIRIVASSKNSKASAHWRTTTETRHRTRGSETEPLAPAAGCGEPGAKRVVVIGQSADRLVR